MLPNESRAQYIEALKLAKASENDAIKRYNVAMSLAESDIDRIKLSEIMNDENEHDAIVTDLLVKAISGEDAKNTTYFAVDSFNDNIAESAVISTIRLHAKTLRTSLNNYNIDSALESIEEINKLSKYLKN